MPAAKHSERLVIYVTKAEKAKFIKSAKHHDAESTSDWARAVLNTHVAEDEVRK